MWDRVWEYENESVDVFLATFSKAAISLDSALVALAGPPSLLSPWALGDLAEHRAVLRQKLFRGGRGQLA